MCGIGGIHGESDPDAVREMVECLEHRGPDDDGYYTGEGISMGMRRLSIIDVEGGKQPIHNEEETVWVVFNGEIYNYPELREKLEEQGHDFYTESDTEVLVHLYEEHGPGFVKKLNGMFAFALWDSQGEELVLARDRLGIKPLYYAEYEGSLYFGSELKALLEGGVPAEPSETGLSYYWQLGYIPAPHTAFEGARKLPPGHVLVVDGEGSKKQRYWDFRDIKPGNGSEEFYRDRLRELLEESVERRMLADVPLGAFLSGGIDSSAIVGLMSEVSERPVKTFSIGFTDAEHDETEFSRLAAEEFGTDHTEYTVSLSDAAIVPEALEVFDEPLADPASIPNHILSEKASGEVKVVNTGSGGDELFGGYTGYRLGRTYWNRLRYVPDPIKTLLRKFGEVSPGKAGRYLEYLGSMTSMEEAYTSLRNPAEEGLETDSPDILSLMEDSMREDADYLANMTAFDIRHYLADYLLVKMDRTTMANSLEARVPFLDHELVEFSRRVPSRYKVKGGTEKYILRKSVEDVLPEKILQREKKGFSVPIEEWMRNTDSPLAQRFEEDRFDDVPFVDEEHLMKRYSKFRSGRDSEAEQLWRALNLQIWHENYVVPHET